MGSEWRKVKLEELVAIEKRNINPQDYKDEYFLHYSIPAYDEGKCPKLEKGMNIKSNKFLIDHNYILLSKLNPRIERVWLPKKLEKKYKQIASTEFIPLLPKANYDRVYCYYLLKFPQLRAFMVQNTKGTSNSHQRMDIHSVLNYEIEVPPLPEQQKIVSILSAFDDKIELNNEMNKTLEEIAQAIFKHWFIDFEFPNENGEPYKSNGGEFVDSELGPIPKGWEVVNLGDVLIEIESGTRPKGGVKEIREGIPSIGAENILGLGKYDYSKTKYIPYEFFNSMKKGIVRNGDVLLYKDGAQIGRKSYFDYNYPFEKCCVNEHVFILRVNESIISQLYLYFWLDQPFMTSKIIKLNANSAQPGINREGVKSLPILIPKKEIVKKWDLIIKPLVKKIFINSHEINVLSQLRDTLLPKLISGEIRVM